jgi:predicted ArsR family transcriptional regulator
MTDAGAAGAETAGRIDRHPTAVIALLAERVRRDLYHFVRREARPVTRDEAATHAGISRKLAGFHLDKLVSGGLLRAHTDRPAVGVGRRPKVYEPSPVEIAVSVPTRHYDLLAELLIDAVDRSTRPGATPGGNAREGTPGVIVATRARAAAHERGTEDGAVRRQQSSLGRLGPERALTTAAEVLDARGYEPARVGPRHVVLRNCPFHRLAGRSRALVCGINQAYCAGVVSGLRAGDVIDAVLEPVDGQCCVQLRG